jgi:predicted secreted protein
MKTALRSLLLAIFGSFLVIHPMVLADNISIEPSMIDRPPTTTQILTLDDARNQGDLPHEIAVGTTLKIQLQNHGSIGESWHFSNFSQEQVLSLGTSIDGTIENSQKIFMPGAPQPYFWYFQPVSVGTTSISFVKTNRYGHAVEYVEFNIIVVP